MNRRALVRNSTVLISMVFILSWFPSNANTVVSDPPDRVAIMDVPWANLPVVLSSAPDLEELLQELAPEMEETFSGAWFDSKGKVKVAITGGQLPARLSNHPRVEMVRHRFSLGYLGDVIRRVTERLNELLASDWQETDSRPYSAWTNAWKNRIEVDVDPRRGDMRREIQDALAEELREGSVAIMGYERIQYQSRQLLDEEKLPDLDSPSMPGDVHAQFSNANQCGPRTNCKGVFRGGTRTRNTATNDVCTLGFPMRDDATGVRFQSTAGHCGDTSTSRWQHAGRDIGRRHKSKGSGDVDFKSVWHTNQQERAPENVIFRGKKDFTRITSKISSPGLSLKGNYLCVEGSFANTQCGRLLDHDAELDGYPGFGLMDAMACKGDSGAPVVADTTDRAYGIVTAGLEGCTAPTWFNWVPRFEKWSKQKVLLSPTTDALGPGQRLVRPTTIESRNGQYFLVMQNDGNLVMYRTGGGAVWATGTNGQNRYAVMQNDGNLVVYGQGCPSGACWASGTSGSQRRLNIQDDGNLVIYTWAGSPIWDRFKGRL